MAKFFSGLCMAETKKTFWKGIKLKNNEKLADDSGFVPLDIRMKKLDIATAQRKLALAQFDYRETEELYDDDINVNQYDSIEELQEKIEIFNSRRKEVLARKFAEYRAQREREANAAAKNQQKETTNQMTSSEKTE